MPLLLLEGREVALESLGRSAMLDSLDFNPSLDVR